MLGNFLAHFGVLSNFSFCAASNLEQLLPPRATNEQQMSLSEISNTHFSLILVFLGQNYSERFPKIARGLPRSEKFTRRFPTISEDDPIPSEDFRRWPDFWPWSEGQHIFQHVVLMCYPGSCLIKWLIWRATIQTLGVNVYNFGNFWATFDYFFEQLFHNLLAQSIRAYRLEP